MQESNLHSDKSWVFKMLIGLYAVNIIMHANCIGISMHGLIFEPTDEFILLAYLVGVLPISMFFAILIMVFNHLKNKKGMKYENYLFTLLLLLSIVLVATMFNICSVNLFQVVVVVLFTIGIVISIRAIGNLRNTIRINKLLK